MVAKLGCLFRHAPICGMAAILLAVGLQAQGAEHPAPAFAHRLAKMPALEHQQDTLEFSEGASRVTPLTAAQAAQAASTVNCTVYCGTTVSYTSWKGNTTTMQEFDGLYVRVLVPQSWFDDATFTESARHTFINGFDLVYQYLYEIVGRRPGTALDTLAYVNPAGCGDGCGSVGGLGAEYDWGWSADSAANGLEGYGEIHEITHNFDSYGGAYKFGNSTLTNNANGPLPDSSHYWTTMLRAIYTYSGNQNSYYDHQYEGWLQSYLDGAAPGRTASSKAIQHAAAARPVIPRRWACTSVWPTCTGSNPSRAGLGSSRTTRLRRPTRTSSITFSKRIRRRPIATSTACSTN